MAMELTRPASFVFSVLFSPADDHLALTGSLDNVVTVWDLKTGRKVKTLKVESGEAPGVSALSMSHDGNYLLTGMKGGGWIKLWNVVTGEEIRSLPGHSFTEAIEALAFSADSALALSGGSYQIRQWDMKTGKELSVITHASFFDRNQSYAIAFSPDARYAFVKGIGFISLWDIQAGQRRWIYGARTGGRRWSGGNMIFNSSARFSPDGKYILSGEDTALLLRDAFSGGVIRTFNDAAIGQIDAVAFSADGKYVLSGSTDEAIRLWDVQTGVKLKKFIGHSDTIDSVAVSADGKRMLSGGDASTRLWDIATGHELATMIEFNKDEWLVITPEGYYNASENGAQYLNVLVGENKYGVDKFYDVFYRPDIVAAKLRGEDVRDLVTIKMSDAIKMPPPSVEFTSTTASKDQSRFTVCYQVKTAGGGIGEVRMFHNGKLIQSDGYYRDMAKAATEKTQISAMNGGAIYENMRSVSIKSKGNAVPAQSRSKGETVEDCREVEAVPGENDVSITAFNSTNTVQGSMKTVRLNSTVKPGEPHLYILSIGVDKYKDNAVNLKYAAKDATDIERMLLKQSGTVYSPGNIHYELLTDDKATKGSLVSKIDELSKKVKANDGFIFFVAGHGVLLQSQYYILTHDYNGGISDTSMISSNELVEMSKRIKALSQLFIFDTCHAGGVDGIVSGLYDARMSVLAKKMGLHIYASASSLQEAQDGYQGNGLFTFMLLDGMNNKKEADRNNDNSISLVELGEYAKQATTEISKKNGHAQTPIIINFGKDSAAYNLKQEEAR